MKKTIDEKTICFLYNPSKRDFRKRIRRKDYTHIDDNFIESCPDNKTVVHLSLITWRYRHKKTGKFLRRATDPQYHEKFYQIQKTENFPNDVNEIDLKKMFWDEIFKGREEEKVFYTSDSILVQYLLGTDEIQGMKTYDFGSSRFLQEKS